MARIGYARVSTIDQDLTRQEARLREAGCDVVFSDKVSGAKASRPQWDSALKALRAGDQLVVTKLDRAGRSLRHLVELSATLRERQIDLVVLDQAIDTSTIEGRFFFNIIAAVAEFERDLISTRTKESLIGRPRGRMGGRPKSLNAKTLARAQALYDAEEMTVGEIGRVVGASESTLYRHLTLKGSDGPRSELKGSAPKEKVQG